MELRRGPPDEEIADFMDFQFRSLSQDDRLSESRHHLFGNGGHWTLAVCSQELDGQIRVCPVHVKKSHILARATKINGFDRLLIRSLRDKIEAVH